MTPRLRLSDPLLRVQSDERLAALAGHGGERAFAILVERHRAALLAFARRLGAGGGAEDVVQQGLLHAWSALRRGTEVEHVSAWMHQIVRNAAIRAAASSLDSAELPATLVAPSETAGEVELRQETRRLLEEIERLPARQREALVRLAVIGSSGEEVGRAMDLEPNAVRQLAHRARTRLRTAMGALVPWPVALWAARGGGGGVAAVLPEALGGAGVASGAGATMGLLKIGAIATTTVAVAVGAGGIAEHHAHHHRHVARSHAAAAVVHARPASVTSAAAVAPAAHPVAAKHDESHHGDGGSSTPHGSSGGGSRHGSSQGGSGSGSSGSSGSSGGSRDGGGTQSDGGRGKAPSSGGQDHGGGTTTTPSKSGDGSGDHSGTSGGGGSGDNSSGSGHDGGGSSGSTGDGGGDSTTPSGGSGGDG